MSFIELTGVRGCLLRYLSTLNGMKWGGENKVVKRSRLKSVRMRMKMGMKMKMKMTEVFVIQMIDWCGSIS